MPVLFVLTTTSCISKPKAQTVLPPRPERTEQKEPQTMQDLAELLNYYEHLVQQWEQWGTTVENMISE